MPHPNEIALCDTQGNVTLEFIALDEALGSPAIGEDAYKREALYRQFNRQAAEVSEHIEQFYFRPDE